MLWSFKRTNKKTGKCHLLFASVYYEGLASGF